MFRGVSFMSCTIRICCNVQYARGPSVEKNRVNVTWRDFIRTIHVLPPLVACHYACLSLMTRGTGQNCSPSFRRPVVLCYPSEGRRLLRCCQCIIGLPPRQVSSITVALVRLLFPCRT